MRRLVWGLMLIVLAGAALAPAASAASPAEGFEKVFPRAAKLCERADAGKLGKALKPDARKVKAACAKLRKRYSDALARFDAAAAPLRQQAADARKQARVDCLQARRNRDPGACKGITQALRTRIGEIRNQMRPLYEAFRQSNQAARQEFWKAIRKLRGGKALKPDTANDAAPADGLPTDAELDGDAA
jgi:hypothetical protein